jgi:hypothetical protein
MKLRKKARKLLERSSLIQAIRNDVTLRWRKRTLHKRAREDAANVRARLDDIVRRWPQEIGTSTTRPIFVFAAGWRSGSTLVQRMLTSVDDIMIWGEPYTRAQLTGTLLKQFRSITMDWPFEYYVEHAFKEKLDHQWIANIYPAFNHLIRAHRTFFTELFEVPARALGRSRWGFKEVRLTSEHALYLKMLYPEAKFIFLYRDPIEAYSSFRGYIRADFVSWPDCPIVTARDFGAMWCRMVSDFSDNYESVGGLLIKYEELLQNPTVHRKLCDYVEADIPPVAAFEIVRGRCARHRGQQFVKKTPPRKDLAVLKRQVTPLLARLGHQ